VRNLTQAPPAALLWQHRRGLLLAEIQSADADIICLQECNHFGGCNLALPPAPCHAGAMFNAAVVLQACCILTQGVCILADDFFQPELTQLGYQGHFSAKSLSPAQQYGCSADGSALFFRSARLVAITPPESAQGY
jgi:hypothetical protein